MAVTPLENFPQPSWPRWVAPGVGVAGSTDREYTVPVRWVRSSHTSTASRPIFGGTVHLRDAMIDNEGNVFGDGLIAYPPDPTGVFTNPEAGMVRVAFRGSRIVEFSSCPARRDPITGYLTAEPVGVRVEIPDDLARILARAIRATPRLSPFTFALDEEGMMYADSGHEASRQGLSDWRGSVSYADTGFRVELSAALRSVLPIPVHRPVDDPWPADADVTSRVSVEFWLDAMTAVVRFGGISKALSERPEPVPSRFVRTSLDAMRLDTAPLGFNGAFSGVTADSKWVSIYNSAHTDVQSSLYIDAPSVLHRYECGLMTPSNRFPRIMFNGIDLDMVGANMMWTRNFGLTLTSNDPGSIRWDWGSPDGLGASSRFQEASLDFELTIDGLVFSYSALPIKSWSEAQADSLRAQGVPSAIVRDIQSRLDRSGQRPYAARLVVGTITIPWEVLILRSMWFGRHREGLLKEG